MPKELEEKLKRQGHRKGFIGERLAKYVYGTLRKTGWTPGTRKKKSKYQRSK